MALASALADRPGDFFPQILTHTPESEVRRKVAVAAALDVSAEEAARALGCGFEITAPDTVPFCLWVAARWRRGGATTMSRH